MFYLLGLVRVRECAEDTSWSSVGNQWMAGCKCCLFERRDLLPVHTHQEYTGKESTEYLRKYVTGDFPPGKALPDGETYCNGRIEVAARCWRASDDGKGNTDGEGPADLKERAECCNPERTLSVDGERGD